MLSVQYIHFATRQNTYCFIAFYNVVCEEFNSSIFHDYKFTQFL